MKKYIILAAATLINICAGGIYGWSVIANALTENFGYTNAQTQLIFGCCFMIGTFTMLITGKLQHRFGARKIASAGACFLAIGYFLASVFCKTYIILLPSLGLMLGFGISCCYMTALSTVSSTFGKRNGFANGIVVAGYGFGAIALSKMFEFYVSSNTPISKIFFRLSLTYGIIAFICSQLLPKKYETTQAIKSDFKFTDYLKDRQYVAMIIGMFLCSFSGLLVIGNLKAIGLNYGLTAAIVSNSIIFMSLGNSSGRVFWGAIYDRFNSKALILMMLLLGLSIAGIMLFNSNAIVYFAMTLLMASCFGGCFSVYPSCVSSKYGKEMLGILYPPIIVFHGLACLIAAPFGGLCFDLTGSFLFALIIASAFAIASLIIHIILFREPKPIEFDPVQEAISVE